MFSWAQLSTLALLVSGSTLATTTPDSIIEPLMQHYQIPGMAVAILHDGKTEFYNYGVASKECGQPINEQTLFEIGSLSKTFTATLASYAAQQNKLKFSDTASRWLPELKGSAFDRVSLLNLATHTSGTPLFVPDEVTNTRPDELVQTVAANGAAGHGARLFQPWYQYARHDCGKESASAVYQRDGKTAAAGDGHDA